MKITKSQLKQIIKEAAEEYVWGVKGPSRVANQYGLHVLKVKDLISEEIDKLFEVTTPAGVAVHSPDVSATGGREITRADADEIAELDREINGPWKDVHEQIMKKATELGVDPQLLSYYGKDFSDLMTAMLDMLYQQYQMERPMPGM